MYVGVDVGGTKVLAVEIVRDRRPVVAHRPRLDARPAATRSRSSRTR